MAKVSKAEIELTNSDAFLALQALQSINSSEIGIDTAFQLAQNLKALRDHVEIYLEFREALYREYCELDERGQILVDAGKYVFKSPEDEKLATEKAKPLNQATVTLGLYTFALSLFAKAKITHTQLEPLIWMFKEEEDTPPAPTKRKGK